MKSKDSFMRKCSPALAAASGMAVCLSGGLAHAVSGVTVKTLVSSGAAQTLLDGKISVRVSMSFLRLTGGNGTQMARATFGFPWHIATYGADAKCTSLSLAGSWANGTLRVNGVPGGDNKYVKIRFNDGSGYKYGWSQYKSLGGGNYQFGAWSYNNTVDGAIKTLADTLATRTLRLSDGGAQLHWSNANEEGVARYVVEMQREDGTWAEVDSDVPGEGSYTAKASGEDTYRLAVEHTDGVTEHIDF